MSVIDTQRVPQISPQQTYYMRSNLIQLIARGVLGKKYIYYDGCYSWVSGVRSYHFKWQQQIVICMHAYNAFACTCDWIYELLLMQIYYSIGISCISWYTILEKKFWNCRTVGVLTVFNLNRVKVRSQRIESYWQNTSYSNQNEYLNFSNYKISNQARKIVFQIFSSLNLAKVSSSQSLQLLQDITVRVSKICIYVGIYMHIGLQY
eukprot:TRINITY_DN4379_c0_g1_i3.p4 TRINITY_DN4379_c0_g1~~TRINITY_DN4379_c0_g1_i3.p4  ORF type:complete len:206 (+),score=-5.88 TRINITY_DN4379_c0_g1_i3:367-984(+)